MAKDPAVLWYWGDWMGGTMTFSRALKGAYMDLLAAQFNNGHLSLDEIKTVLASDFGSMWPTLQKKFAKDDGGLYFNERLKTEKEKRSGYTKSRRDNLNNKSSHMVAHMDNENESVNKNIVSIDERQLLFCEQVGEIGAEYDLKMLKLFGSYWTERNPNGKKMRFEMEKVFDIKRRLKTWSNNQNKFNNGKESSSPTEAVQSNWGK